MTDTAIGNHRTEDAAINRVLAAERDARDAVADCRRQARAMLAAAEEDARAVTGRAEGRIRAAHGIAERGIERALAELRGQVDDSVDPAPAPERLDALVAELARELAGPTA